MLKKIFNNRNLFLLPILLTMIVSISHVITWYDIANPSIWAIFMSIAVEVGAMVSLVAATNRIKGGVWFMFFLVTSIQMIGNIFYSFKEIDETGTLFTSWVELTGPFWDLFTDSTDITSMKRWLSFLEGGLLPVISLTSLHFYVKYEKPLDIVEIKTEVEVEDTIDDSIINDLIDASDNGIKSINDQYDSKLREESKRVFEKIKELKEEGKLTEPIEEEHLTEPTALANSQYRLEDTIEPEEIKPEDNSLNRNLGIELNKTWNNIINKRQSNSIGRID